MSQGKNFLYYGIYDDLKRRILNGQYRYDTLLPSERALCEEYGVWRATVRKALDMLSSEGLVEKMVGVGTRVIFCTEDSDINLVRHEPQQAIAFFVTDGSTIDRRLSQPYYSDFLYYLDRASRPHNFQTLFANIHSKENMLSVLQNNDIVFAIFLTHRDFEFIELARTTGIPVALVNEEHLDFATITCDHVKSGYMAIKYLFDNGHTDIGIISGPTDYMSASDKMAGCIQACYECNIPFPREPNLQFGNWEYESGYSAANLMISKGNLDSLPTAIFSFNDSMCIGAMHAIREKGYRIPEDISIIGSDNMRHLKYSEPTLTTIDTGIERTASVAVLCALKSIDFVTYKGIKITTPVSLVVRDTVLDISQMKQSASQNFESIESHS